MTLKLETKCITCGTLCELKCIKDKDGYYRDVAKCPKCGKIMWST